jgi:hypothetical protein
MGAELEVAGAARPGTIVATVTEGKAETPAHAACRNCGAPLNGRFCSTCAQPAHLHRSLVSLGHDILHGVFHFEGKIWRTLPELFFHPGRLTRRYIDGERAKFVSPMALYLFTVFLMFAVFSITGGGVLADRDKGNSEAMEAATKGERSRLVGSDRKPEANAVAGTSTKRLSDGDVNVELGWPALDRKLTAGLRHLNENPDLLLYKLKSTGYKFSWALIPLSLPFLWLMFFWRRDIHVYDHAIFVTYSISFVMLLLVVLSIATAAGASSDIGEAAMVFVPPVHLYKQLRGAYGVSRTGAFVRLFLLLISICIVLVLFSLLLLLLGVLG